MLIATWNVNGIRARLPRLKEWLAERKPDIACLQELKVVDGEFPYEELRAAGYETACACQQSWNGVAVIAKATKRPELLSNELAGAADAGARFIATRVDDLEVVSVYVPNGKTVSHPDFPLKLAWLDALIRFVEARPDKRAPFVLAGDLNVCPTDLDSFGGAAFRGGIFHTNEERDRIARLQAAGLIDVFRTKYPEDPGFSFWDYRAGAFHKKLGMRIDMVLVSEPVAARAAEVFVDREYRKKSKVSGAVPSDHAPVVMRLD